MVKEDDGVDDSNNCKDDNSGNANDSNNGYDSDTDNDIDYDNDHEKDDCGDKAIRQCDNTFKIWLNKLLDQQKT